MRCGRALRFAEVAFVVATLLGSSFADLCPFAEGLTGIGEEFPLVDKLSVIGFSATVNYVSLPADASPFLKIIAASQEPTVSSDNGLLVISADSSCEASDIEDASGDIKATSSASALMFGTMASFLGHRSAGSLLILSSLVGLLGGVYGDEHTGTCKPTLEIEISLPGGSEVSASYGETDHYLAATNETVTWGYFDSNATPKATAKSGETITVEVITHHSSHDYAKMIRGDEAVEGIFYWATGQSLTEKPVPKLPGTGVHLITGPIAVTDAMPGDVVQVDILELDPRLNPATGKCYGTNSQKFAGYQYNSMTGFKKDGTPYVRTGGTEAITVFEFAQTEGGRMAWAKPVYMYRFPNMTAPDGSQRTFDNNPSVVIPHEYNHGYNGELMEEEPIDYPEGYDGTTATDEGGILYLSPEQAKLNWKVPLRPHIGLMGVMPSNTDNYIDADAQGGANSIPPSKFGGNIDDWRIGKGGTMYYQVEVPDAMIVLGDTHAAQGDAELAGTAMETSMTAKIRITLHKASSLPAKVTNLTFPLLETSDQYVVHGFAYENYLDELEDPSTIFQEGATLDKAMADCFIKTRNWLMDVMGLIEEETIALMSTAVDFGVTQVVDGNWGVHADIDKWIFDESDAPYDYSCTTSKSNRRFLSKQDDRHLILEQHGVTSSPEEYADELYSRVTKDCASCRSHVARKHIATRMLDAKLKFARLMEVQNDRL